MPWHLYLAIKQLFPTGKRCGSFFFLMSVAGVALGVMVLVVVQSVMSGFGQVHRARMIEATGHIDITANGRPFRLSQGAERQLLENSEVLTVGPYAQGFTMAQYGSIIQTPTVIGIDPSIPEAYGLLSSILVGNLDDLDDGTAIISRNLSYALGVVVGDSVDLYTPNMVESLSSSEVVLPTELEIVAIYDLDWNPEYAPGLIVTLRAMQDFYNLDSYIHGASVRLREGANEFEVARELDVSLPPGVRAQTWKERWASFLWVLDLEKNMMLFINLFVVLVAVFAIAIAQLLNVIRKTREIGVIGAFGGRPREIAAIYCWQGFLIGLLGNIFGVASAMGVLSLRDPVIEFISTLTGTKDTLVQFYYFSHLPVNYETSDFVVITVSAMILSTLAGLIPAWRAGRLRPATAIRAEF